MKESIIAVVRAIFLLCTCFSIRHSGKPIHSFVYLETPPSLSSFPFFPCWLDSVPLFEPLRLEAVSQTLQLLLPQLDLVLKLSLLNDEGRLHFHKVLVVC